jgi:hypothetical protein
VNGYLAGFLAIVTGIAIAAVGELVSEEIRDRLDQVPRGILRLAARWLDPGQRATVYLDEWEPELVYILKGTEARPVTRLITGTWYALGILANTRRIARHLHRPAPGQTDLAAADAPETATGHGRVLTRVLSRLQPGVLLSYKVQYDMRIAADNQAGLQITGGESGAPIPDASLVTLRISNLGRRRVKTNGPGEGSLVFTFGGRRVVKAMIGGSSSLDTASRVLGEPGIQVAGSSVALPAVDMDSGDCFQLLVLLSDAGAGVTGACGLADVHFARDRGCIRELRTRREFPPG